MIKVTLIYHILYFLLFIVISSIVSYLLYRKTSPPVSKFFRILLTMLRGIVLALLILVIFKPLVYIKKTVQQKAHYAVLIDNSASVRVENNGVSGEKTVRGILSDNGFKELEKKSNVEYYIFSNTIREKLPEDTLEFSGEGTNVSRAFRDLLHQKNKENLNGIILISDGIYNVGEHPASQAEKSSVPIFTIGIGDTTGKKDIVVTDVTAKTSAYINEKITVETRIRSDGINGGKTTLSLMRGGEVVETKITELPLNGLEKSVKFSFAADKEGMNKYTIFLLPLDGEFQHENNKKSFYIKVLKNKTNVFVVGGVPDPDYSFIIRSLRNNDKIELTAYAEKKDGSFFYDNDERFPEGINKADAIFFVFYPTEYSQMQYFDILNERIKAENIPICVVTGKLSFPRAIQFLSDIVPCEYKSAPQQRLESYIRLTEEGLNHHIMRIAETNADNLSAWNTIPPFYFSGGYLQPKNQYRILALIDNKSGTSDIPFVVCSPRGAKRFVLVNGFGIWRWDLLLSGDSGEMYDTFINNITGWLTDKENEKKVSVFTDKEIYRSGEEIIITAQVYDDNYRPLDNAFVRVTMKGEGITLERNLSGTGGGKYEERIDVIEPGKYEYRGDVSYYDRKIGSDEGEFYIGEFSIELLETKARHDILRQVSDLSGGSFYKPQEASVLFSNLSSQTNEKVKEQEVDLYNKWVLMVIIILLLAIEWFIRKRLGML